MIVKLEAGPIALLDPTEFGVDVEPKGFLADAIAREAVLGAIDTEIGDQVAELVPVAFQFWGEALEQPLLEAAAHLDPDSNPELLQGWDDVRQAAGEVDEHVVRATHEAPDETWQPVPEPIQQPAETTVFSDGSTPDQGANQP